MKPGQLPDHYETLQVSPRADSDTIERVFRLLAKRYHPDNAESGNAERFTALLEAFRILSQPEARAQYDVHYEAAVRERWRVFGPPTDAGADATDAATDHRLQSGLLSILFKARRHDADRPGVGIMDMERLLGCPESQMRYHLWYLKEQGWIARQDNGMFAITAAGVDRVMQHDDANRDGIHLLKPGHIAAAAG